MYETRLHETTSTARGSQNARSLNLGPIFLTIPAGYLRESCKMSYDSESASQFRNSVMEGRQEEKTHGAVPALPQPLLSLLLLLRFPFTSLSVSSLLIIVIEMSYCCSTVASSAHRDQTLQSHVGVVA